jgi:uncharacterized protein
MSSYRFVLDTNLIISAVLLKQSTSRQAFDRAIREGEILLSTAVIAELDTTLRREKFNRYLLEHERLEFLARLVREATLVEVNITITACRDPKDNKFLELAVAGNANCIVSGDNDLLSLHPFQGILILNPHAFLNHDW